MAIFDQVPDEQQFQIIKDRRFSIGVSRQNRVAASLRLVVIGASHYISFETEFGTFAEVFSCHNNFQVPPLHSVQLSQFNGDSDSRWRYVLGRTVYHATFRNISEEEVSAAYLADYMGDCPWWVRVDFPTGEYDGIPFTAVGARLEGTQLFIRSIHGYNHEQRVILSESSLNTERFFYELPKPHLHEVQNLA